MQKLTLVVALGLAVPLYAQIHKMKPGNYHMVVTHEMVGMPFTPPPTNLDKCVTPEDAGNPQKLSHHNDKCEQKEFKQSGNKLTFAIICHEHGGTQTGSGEYVFGDNQWTGTVTIEMQNPKTGQPMKMINHIQSTRTGDCAK